MHASRIGLAVFAVGVGDASSDVPAFVCCAGSGRAGAFDFVAGLLPVVVVVDDHATSEVVFYEAGVEEFLAGFRGAAAGPDGGGDVPVCSTLGCSGMFSWTRMNGLSTR